jgi:hypothetical protein
MIRSDAAAPGLSGPTGAAMEGGGSYNRNSAQQGAGGISALPLLEKAAASVAIEPDDDPVVIADFGSSQGRNSLLPLGTAIKSLRRRLGVDRPISVFHTDQPGNDFSTLFQVVHTDPGSYLRGQPNVFTFATGKSFYEPLFPPNRLCQSNGWSSARGTTRPPLGRTFKPRGLATRPRQQSVSACRLAGRLDGALD